MSPPSKSSYLIPVLVIYLLAFLERTYFDLGPNIELVTLATLVSAVYLSTKSSLKLTLILMIFTDLIIGNTRIFIFTWSGFLLPIIIIKLLIPQPFRSLGRGRLSVLKTTGLGILANLFFFIWTNFGVWLLDSFGMYPDTFTGLIQSYLAGLPFLRLQLLSTLLFVPLGFLSLSLIRSKQPKAIYSAAKI